MNCPSSSLLCLDIMLSTPARVTAVWFDLQYCEFACRYGERIWMRFISILRPFDTVTVADATLVGGSEL